MQEGNPFDERQIHVSANMIRSDAGAIEPHDMLPGQTVWRKGTPRYPVWDMAVIEQRGPWLLIEDRHGFRFSAHRSQLKVR